MFVHRPNQLDPVGGTETPQAVYCNRRKWLRAAGWTVGAGVLSAGAYGGWRWYRGSDEQVVGSGFTSNAADIKQRSTPIYPAPRDTRFAYGREETDRIAAARYTNFYEVSSTKSTWRYVDGFEPLPWTIEVAGLCRQPRMLDLDDFQQQFATEFVERQYRHRCVEAWAMAVPWTGVPLARVIAAAEPLPSATHVAFTSFLRPDEAPQQTIAAYPWPYTEGLTLPEAAHELSLLATGIYGQPLSKQHGAPIRLVVPWKYGFKSIKSVQRIEFVDQQPPTFWSTIAPDAYPFQANVEPEVPRPWPQDMERMLGTGERFPTQIYNGYEEYVAHLYAT